MSAPPAPAEDDTLQLPLLGLYGDLEAGQGSVQLPDEFKACSPAVQLELLRDWQRGLNKVRDLAMKQLFIELLRGRDGLPPAQQLALFHTTCTSLGLEVPADFAAPRLPA
jgi:hypothetical protein